MGGLAYVGPAAAHATVVAPSWTAYVADTTSNTVVPIDTATNTAGSPITVGTAPTSIAITPNAKTAYVVNSGSNSVTPIDTATNTAGTAIPVGNDPAGIAISPNGQTVYVTNEGSNTVTPISTATNTAGTPIPAGSSPFGIVITRNGNEAFVGNLSANTVTPIDLSSGTTEQAIPVGTLPFNLALTPGNTTLYVADEGSNTVIPIDAVTGTEFPAIAVGTGPNDIAVTPDGNTAFVTDSHGNAITPIDTQHNTAGTPITVAAGAAAIAFTPDGSTAYVSNNGPTVTPINTSTKVLGTAITVGGQAAGIAITPDQAPVAELSVVASRPGTTSTFDASASTVVYGTIASYAWDFGDGHQTTTSTPTTTHTYAAAGTYTTTVTETSSGGTSTGNTFVFTGRTVSLNGGPSAVGSSQANVLAAGAYSALAPFRICDSRSNTETQCSGETLGAGQFIGLQISGVQGPALQMVPSGAIAVVINLTGINHGTSPTYLVAYPSGTTVPHASSDNIDAGAAQANLAIVPLSSDGRISIFNAAGSADFLVDVQGYFAEPGGASEVPGEFHPMPPLRICDTRAKQNTECAGAADNPLPANTWRHVVLSGLPPGAAGGTPSIPTVDAAAAAFNLTAVHATLSTYLAVAAPNMTSDACPTGKPAVSNVNPHPGEALPNRVLSNLGPHQDVCIYNAAGSVDFIIDVNGWFGSGSETTSPSGALYYAVSPERICDTRTGSGTLCAGRPLSGSFTETVHAAGVGVLPALGGASSPVAIVANLTGIAGTASTVLVLYPSDAAHIPKASDLKPNAHDVIDNLAIVSLATTGPSAGDLNLTNALGVINVTLDVSGWFQ
jgi:YVTN family beta-propeller protein